MNGSDANIKLVKALGMKYNEKTGEVSCSGRPGYVYVKKDGKVHPLARDAFQKILKMECEHEAVALITEYYRYMFVVGLQCIMRGANPPKLPDASDFRYVFADEEPEVEVTCTAEADELLAKIKGALR